MTVRKTKDFGNGKANKVRLAVGRKLGKPGEAATDKEIDDEMTQHCRDLVAIDEQCNYDAAKPAPDQL